MNKSNLLTYLYATISKLTALDKYQVVHTQNNQKAYVLCFVNTVKLGDKERFDKEQIGVKETFPMTNCQFTS